MVSGAKGPEALLSLYQKQINAHDFDLLAALFADDAVVWFNDGSHTGIVGIRAAFEKTWASFPVEQYWLEDIRWLGIDSTVAACVYRFCWTATIDGVAMSGGGRGTSVLALEGVDWKIVHEHLSQYPPQ